MRPLWGIEEFGTGRCGKISLPHSGNLSALSPWVQVLFRVRDKVGIALALTNHGQQVDAGAFSRIEQIKWLLFNRSYYSHGKGLELG